MTKKEKILTYLMHNGYEKTDSPSDKYLVFKLPMRCRGSVSDYYFVGENGSVRVGKNISRSISITTILTAKIEVWFERQRAKGKERDK